MSNARVDQLVRESYLRQAVNARVDQLVREVWVHTVVGLVQVIGGNFQDPSSAPIANGTLVVQLVSDSQESSGPAQVVAGVKTTIPLDNTGNVSGTHFLWSNISMAPTGSYYSFQLYDQTGILCWRKPLIGVIPDQPTYDLALLLQN